MIVVQNVCTKLVTLVLSCSTWVYRDTYSDLESCHNSHSTCILAQEQLAMLSALGRDFAPRNRDWSCWNPKGALGNVNSNQNPNKVRSVMVIACYVFFLLHVGFSWFLIVVAFSLLSLLVILKFRIKHLIAVVYCIVKYVLSATCLYTTLFSTFHWCLIWLCIPMPSVFNLWFLDISSGSGGRA